MSETGMLDSEIDLSLLIIIEVESVTIPRDSDTLTSIPTKTTFIGNGRFPGGVGLPVFLYLSVCQEHGGSML